MVFARLFLILCVLGLSAGESFADGVGGIIAPDPELGGGVLTGGASLEKANPSLYNCLNDATVANDCNANTIYNLRIFQPNAVDEVTGYYDEDGRKCASVSADTCIFHVTASFQPHCADVAGAPVSSCKKADSLVVNWSVQQFKQKQNLTPMRSIATGSSTELPSVSLNVSDIMTSAGLQPDYGVALCNLEQTQLQSSGGISTSCGVKDTVIKLANSNHSTDECAIAGGQVVEVTSTAMGSYNPVAWSETAGTMTVNGTEVTQENFANYNKKYHCLIASGCPLGPGVLWVDAKFGKGGGSSSFCY